MPRFAANLSMLFTELPFERRFQAAADAGFEAVEFLFPYAYAAAEIAGWRGSAAVELALFNLPPGDWDAGERGLAALPGRRREFEEAVGAALRYADILGVRRLHVMAGIAEPDSRLHREAYLASLDFAAEAAKAQGVTLLVEPINRRDMPGYFLNDFGLAVELLEELDRENVRLQFDVYHRQMLHGDVLTALEKMLPLIGHVQIASVPGRNEPGSGELDDFKVLRRLDDLGYDGFVGCEYRPMASTPAGLEWLVKFQNGSMRREPPT